MYKNLVTNIVSFSHNFFKDFFSQGYEESEAAESSLVCSQQNKNRLSCIATENVDDCVIVLYLKSQ